MDDALAALSTLQTAVTVGSTLVLVGAAAVGAAPEIGLAAGAVATYSALAGVVIGSAAMGNDIYNLATNGWTAVEDYGTPNFSNDVKATLASSVALATDTGSTFLQAEGLGWSANVADATASVMSSILNTTSEDVASAAKGLALQTVNMASQDYLGADATASQASLQQLPASPGIGGGFCPVNGSVNVTNAQGPILSGLTGVAVTDPTGALQLEGMADESGQYSLVLPLGDSGVDYSTLMLSAYDPVQNTVLGSIPLNASAFTSGVAAAGPTPNGTCNDSDAGSPDADDPDCD